MITARCFGFYNEQIDFKSICSTGTAGVVLIPSSPDKRWNRALWNTTIPDFDGEIFDHFVEKWHSKKYKLPTEIVNDKVIYKPNDDDYDTTIGDEYFDKINFDDSIEQEIIDIMNKLNVKRSENYNSWIEMLWCLKNMNSSYILGNDNFFKSLWLEFSAECIDKYNKEYSIRLWNNTVPRVNGLKYGTLKHWFKLDNPELFLELDDNDKDKIIDFIKINFKYGKSKILNIIVKRYEDNKFIFVNINENWCKNINDEHDIGQIFIIISCDDAKEKCRLCDVIIGKIVPLSDDLKEITHRIIKKRNYTDRKIYVSIHKRK